MPKKIILANKWGFDRSLLKKGWWLFLLAVTLFLADFLLKSYVNQNIPIMSSAFPFYPYGGIPVFHHFYGISFSINHILNRGAAWGMFASFQEVLLYLRIVVINGLFIHFLFFNRDRFKDIPFVLIITGASANVVDYFVYGQVVDMFYFTFGSYSFPLFNIADSAIFSGVALLLLSSMVKKKSLCK